MPSKFIPIKDDPPIRGMNTVDDPRELKAGECELLINATPGAPPVPRKGCQGYLLAGSSSWRFIPPGISVTLAGVVYIVIWVYDSGDSAYKLKIFLPTTTGATTSLGTAEFTAKPYFGFLEAYSSLYCSISQEMDTWNNLADPISHKVIESASVIRDMCISQAAYINSPNRVGDESTGVFSIGDCVEYSFQFVRHNDLSAWETGTADAHIILPPGATGKKPKELSVFVPGCCLSPEFPEYRVRIAITADSTPHILYYVSFDVDANYNEAMRQGATHMRVCRTRRGATEVAVTGATKYFAYDFPLNGTTLYFYDKKSDASLDGELNQLITGYTVAPVAPFIELCKQRIWLFARDGKGYYSEIPNGGGETDGTLAQANPQLWGSLFKATEYFVDIDSMDGKRGTGLARMGDDLYFFKENKISCLFGGDPSAAVPTVISNEVGCPFPGTITKAEVKGYLGKCLLFMGSEGPMVIMEGGNIRPFSEFKIAELWSSKSTELYSELYSHYDWIVENCTAAFHQNNWIVMYRTYAGINKVLCFYFDQKLSIDQNAPRGPWQLKFGDL